MADDNNLDLLDLEEEVELDDLPMSDPFAGAARPKRPWLLLAAAVLVIILATYIIIKVVGGGTKDSVDIDLGTPEPVQVITPSESDRLIIGGDEEQPAAVAAPQPVNVGTPVRQIEDRKPVKFDPDAPSAAPKPRPAAQATTPAAKKPATPTTGTSSYYVQFGSYSTRALAEAAQRKIVAGHPSLLSGKQFVILAAVLPNGSTTYRLRVGFKTVGEADGFCRNAKSDGLDCYVAR